MRAATLRRAISQQNGEPVLPGYSVTILSNALLALFPRK